jgi:Mlc titration factor MtfA (ptsG expression regulator)
MKRGTTPLLLAIVGGLFLLTLVAAPVLLALVGSSSSYAVGWVIAGVLEVGVILVAIRWNRQGTPNQLVAWLADLTPSRLLQQRRRSRLVSAPFPAEWLDFLKRNVAIYQLLSEEEQARLRDDLRIVAEEHGWEGCAGLEVTDEMKVTIAALACVLLLGIDHDHYAAVSAILVYPAGFTIPEEHMGSDGVMRQVGALGQAWYRGPVVLAWDAVLRGGRTLGGRQNLVYHEFAHALDFTGDSAGWSRQLSQRNRREQIRRWQQVMTHEYQRLVFACEHGYPTLLDPYGATNQREFFAVATECFFQQSAAMQRDRPELYEVLRDYYNQDPAMRAVHHGHAWPAHREDRPLRASHLEGGR